MTLFDNSERIGWMAFEQTEQKPSKHGEIRRATKSTRKSKFAVAVSAYCNNIGVQSRDEKGQMLLWED